MQPALPDILRSGVTAVLETVGRGLPDAERAALERVLACSPYAAECMVRNPGLLATLHTSGRLLRPDAPGELAGLLREQIGPQPGDEDFQRVLRRFRHRELLRIIWRDLSGRADVPETLDDLSGLADTLIRAAVDHVSATLKARHGQPRTEEGDPAGPGVLAMGKLGGRELNFSSDVDLVFLYTAGGDTDGPRSISNEEYFRLLAQRVIDLLSRQTSDGFVYRVDTRLRPFGSAGPLAVSVAALESYLVRHGREWERYAYVKARMVNDFAAADVLFDEVIRPFVFRRYLDYGVFASLREMKALVEAEGRRREYGDNLKLGPGGIREVEFTVQALQLVRGGAFKELREPHLLTVLPRLAGLGLLPDSDATELGAAYRFLRLAENRLQAIADRQTHDLPADEADRTRLRLAMGFGSWDGFIEVLSHHRGAVRRSFRDVVFRDAGRPADESDDCAPVWLGALDTEEAEERLRAQGYADPTAAARRLTQLRDGNARRLGETGRQRLDLLVPAIIQAAARQPDPDRALASTLRIVDAVGRRSTYFALLNENPAALERLVRLCGNSEFLTGLMAAHPLLLDELIDPRISAEPPTRAELEGDLAIRLRGVTGTEARLDALRNFQQAAIFRVAVVDLSGALPLMKVSDRLTDTAELVLDGALRIAWAELTGRHGEPFCTVDGVRRPARFAIVGYGKLGGLELGYGSDLDLVFLNDSAGEDEMTAGPRAVDNTVFFSNLARRIISILTMHTSTGTLYDVDTRLRPSGRSGLLVSSLTAFDRYQRDDAWTWEHQALLRSRMVAGDADVGMAFEAIRLRALTGYVRLDRLRGDVTGMRQRMRQELSRGSEEVFDLKQDPGGMADIEFLVQYLVLREAAAHPELVHWSDNIRQLEALAGVGILDAGDAETLAEIYRSYRRRTHRLDLAGEPGLVPRAEFAPYVDRVRGLWAAVFGD